MKPSIGIICLLSVSLISWDRASKNLAKAYLKDKPALAFVHDNIKLEYVENTGAAARLGDHLNPTVSFWLLGIAPLVILTGLFLYMLTHARSISAPKQIALTLIFAGGMGNILDRLIYDRHVTDFINIDLPIVRGYIFNFADVWITAGVLLLAIGAKPKLRNLQS